MNSEKTISPFGGEQEGAFPKGFWQWAIWFNNHLYLSCLLLVYISALVPVFWLPENDKSTMCIVLGMYFGFFSEIINKSGGLSAEGTEKDKLERKVFNLLGYPFIIIAITFLIVWACINKYPAEFLPQWAMGLVVFVGAFFGMGIAGMIKSHREDSKREKIEEERKYNERILKNQLAEKIRNTPFTIEITGEDKRFCFHDQELYDIVKQLKGKK